MDILSLPPKVRVHNLLTEGYRNMKEISEISHVSLNTCYYYKRQYLSNTKINETVLPTKIRVHNLLAKGHSLKEISEITGLHYNTCYKHRQSYIEERGIDEDKYAMTCKEVGEQLSLSEGQVHATQAAAIKKMKAYIKANDLEQTLMQIFELGQTSYEELQHD